MALSTGEYSSDAARTFRRRVVWVMWEHSPRPSRAVSHAGKKIRKPSKTNLHASFVPMWASLDTLVR